MGNETISCKRSSHKRKARVLQVSVNTAQMYEASQRQKSETFREKYKKRAAREWKNGKMKRFHGLARARGYGRPFVTQQAKLTAIAVNLKRIAALFQEKQGKGGGNHPAFSFSVTLFYPLRLQCCFDYLAFT